MWPKFHNCFFFIFVISYETIFMASTGFSPVPGGRLRIVRFVKDLNIKSCTEVVTTCRGIKNRSAPEARSCYLFQFTVCEGE